MVDRGSCSPSPTSRSRVFDPFVIGPNHHEHVLSTSIIKLEESDKVFCPLCLEKNPTDGVERASDELFNQYVTNLFEALDQNSEKIKLRMIVIPTLTVLLKKRQITIRSDHGFHNILRIIYKVMTSHQFNLNEFNSVVTIYSIVSERYIATNPIPYLSIWKATEHMMNYVEKQVQAPITIWGDSPNQMLDFLSSSTIIPKTYLEIMGRFSIDKVSDLIFPLYENDDPLKHNKVHYINSQIKCLDFMSDYILNRCWISIISVRGHLDNDLCKMAGNLFVALNECIKSATRLEHKRFLDYVIKTDFLSSSHQILGKDTDPDLRSKIKSFLNTYVFFYIESDFGSDRDFRELRNTQDIVETNHKNAIARSQTNSYRKTIFYFLINCVAMKQKSRYFNQFKIKKVIKCIDPEFMKLRESKVLIRVYSYLIAANVPKLSIYENVENFIVKIWRQMKDDNKFTEFDEEFCYDQTVLYWAYEHPDFIKMVTIKTIRYIGERSIVQGSVERNFRLLMKNKHYKPIVISYLRDDESVASIIDEIVKTDSGYLTASKKNKADHESLVKELSAIILALFHDSLLLFNNDGGYSSSKRVYRLINLIVIMLTNCEHFELIFDDQFILDLFKFVEIIYTEKTDKYDDLIVLTNEFMASIMISNSPYLMKILKNLDFTALGYMYHRIADYTKGDQVGESIARLLIAYDNIDYPLDYNISRNLCQMAKSALNWALSGNDDLYKLSLQLASRVLMFDLGQSTKVYVSTGILHMLITSPEILLKPEFLDIFLSILDTEELKYSPLVDQLLDVVPVDTRKVIEQKLSSDETRSISPIMSFDSDESCNYDDDHNTVANILAQFEEVETIQPINSNRVPTALYASKNIQDQHTDRVDCEAWERRAHQIAKHDQMAEPF